MNIIGIDLAAKPSNTTGIAVLNEKNIYLDSVLTDEDIMGTIKEYKPFLIAIDAPLSLPEGRCCLEKDCACSIGGHFRQSDKEMRKYGGVFPLTFRGMKILTFRGISLQKKIKNEYFEIKLIEAHPRTSQKLFGLNKDNEKVFHYLKKYFRVNKIWEETNEHEIDAALAALTALFYSSKKYKELGKPEEGTIIIPELINDFESEIENILNF